MVCNGWLERELEKWVAARPGGAQVNGKYVGNRPIRLKKSAWKERNIDSEKNQKIPDLKSTALRGGGGRGGGAAACEGRLRTLLE